MYRVIKNIPLEDSEDGIYVSKEELDEDNRFLLLEGAVFKNKVAVVEKYPEYFEFIPDEICCQQSATIGIDRPMEEVSHADHSI